MNKRISYFAVFLLLAVSLQAVAEPQRYVASSDGTRMPMLELYTSEGCSSCPPAEEWISRLKGVDYIIPLAFHVTYWNYIGWQDPFSDISYDSRQRTTMHYNKLNTVYTPQFVFDGNDLRGGSNFHRLIRETNQQAPLVNLRISALVNPGMARVTMNLDRKKILAKDVELYLAVYENNLVSHVEAGENDGRVLKHDFVVRHLYGPFTQTELGNKGSVEQNVGLLENWKPKDIGFVLFAQNAHTGEILQAVRLALNP